MMSVNNVHSLPNLRSSSEKDYHRLYSLSLSHIRKRTELQHNHNINYKPAPFNIRWIYGYNPRVGVINLNDKGKTIMFYAASNCGVVYNWTEHQMMILQGHKHLVTSIAISGDGKWMVTADSGPEDVVIIWDSSDYFPQRTIFNPHGTVKLAKVDISFDAKYLLTMGYQEKTILHWWIWSFGQDLPHATLEVNIPRNGVVDMIFNPHRSDQFIITTKNDLWIGISTKIFITERGSLRETDNYELKIRMVEKKSGPDHGKFNCLAVVNESSQILVATTRGWVLVYGYTSHYDLNVRDAHFEALKFVKVLKIETNAINVIKSIDGVIVTGNKVGEIKFYDNQMKLLYWVHGFNVDNVKGLSFNISPRSYQVYDPKCHKVCPCWEKISERTDSKTGLICQKLLKKDIASDATVAKKPFLVRDFIICSYNEGVSFVDFLTEKLVTILDNKISSATAISVHPENPLVCVGYADGKVELYNYLQHKLFLRIDLPEHYKTITPENEDSIRGGVQITTPEICVTCLKYSPSGLHLTCGLDTGELVFLHPTVLNIIGEVRAGVDAIALISYSCDSLTMAVADKGRKVSVFRYDCLNHVWNLVGKHRAHYKDITTLLFLPKKNENSEYKLLSLGLDRIMVEYDIGESSNEYLEVFSLDRVEQSALPLAAIPWPMPTDLNPDIHRDDLPLILIANDEFKYKIVNYGTTMTLSTVLGPRRDHPVCRMQLVTRRDAGEGQYLLYATKNIIGLQKLPLDGNPWKHAGQFGHPIEVLDMCFHEENKVLFTIGAKDSCVTQWVANYNSVDITTKQGGIDLDPYYCLIENGRPGWLFQEIRDLFYYIQILCQGTFSPAVRQVKDYIPIESLPDLMRTLGFFPSEYEVENLITEAKFKVYQKAPSDEIDFEEFVKLYLNHRPAFGESFMKIRNAYRHTADMGDDTHSVHRDVLIHLLVSSGECLSRELCWYLLSILSGQSFEERAAMKEHEFLFLPEKMTLEEFMSSILGVSGVEFSEQSTRESMFSAPTLSSDSEEASRIF